MSRAAMAEFALDYLGWALLCMGLPRYWQTQSRVLPRAPWLYASRTAGWLSCLVALALAIHRWGIGIGVVAWCAVWMLSAMGWVLLQPYVPRIARVLAPTLLVLAAISCMAS